MQQCYKQKAQLKWEMNTLRGVHKHGDGGQIPRVWVFMLREYGRDGSDNCGIPAGWILLRISVSLIIYQHNDISIQKYTVCLIYVEHHNNIRLTALDRDYLVSRYQKGKTKIYGDFVVTPLVQ